MRSIFSLFGLVSIVLSLNCASTIPTQSVKVEVPTKEDTPTKLSTKELIAKTGSYTVALVYKNADGEVRPYCTGVWIGETKILTAHHCVNAMAEKQSEDASTPVNPLGIKIHYTLQSEVENVGEEPTTVHLAKSIALDHPHDLAMVEAQGKTVPQHLWAPLAFSSPLVGEHIFIVGHPIGLYWTFTEGVVSAYREKMSGGLDIEGPFLQASAPVYFGNSGGGAFNDQGELIGIASFIVRAPHTGFFIELRSIKNFVSSVE